MVLGEAAIEVIFVYVVDRYSVRDHPVVESIKVRELDEAQGHDVFVVFGLERIAHQDCDGFGWKFGSRVAVG